MRASSEARLPLLMYVKMYLSSKAFLVTGPVKESQQINHIRGRIFVTRPAIASRAQGRLRR